jgi:uncharacterized coiled-coil protein SlyX
MEIRTSYPIFIKERNTVHEHVQDLDTEVSKRRDILSSRDAGASYVGCDASNLIASEKRAVELEVQSQVNSNLLARQQSMATQIDQVKRVSDKLSALINRFGISGPEKQDAVDEITSCLQEIESVMNSQYNNDYTLSGVSIKTKAVLNLMELPKLVTGQGIDYSYYAGGANDQTIMVNDYTQVNLYPVTGRHDFFAKTIQAARVCLTLDPKDCVSDSFHNAKQMSTEATTHDYSNTIYKLGIEKSKLKAAVDAVPAQLAIEAEKCIVAGKLNKEKALSELTVLESSKQNALNMLIKQSILDRKLNEEIFNAMQ